MDSLSNVFKESTSKDVAEKAYEDELEVVSMIMQEMMDDDSDDSAQLLMAYKEGTQEQRAIMDYVLVCLCGWTMNSIIKKCKKEKRFTMKGCITLKKPDDCDEEGPVTFLGLNVNYEGYSIPYDFEYKSVKVEDDKIVVQFKSINEETYEVQYDELLEEGIDPRELSTKLLADQFSEENSGTNYIEIVFDSKLGELKCEEFVVEINGNSCVVDTGVITLVQRKYV